MIGWIILGIALIEVIFILLVLTTDDPSIPELVSTKIVSIIIGGSLTSVAYFIKKEGLLLGVSKEVWSQLLVIGSAVFGTALLFVINLFLAQWLINKKRRSK